MLGTVSCDSATAPQLFVYADRPIVVPTSSLGWRSVSVGGSHTCAIRLDGALYCWGANASGQLGVGVARGHCGRPVAPCEGSPRAVAPNLRFLSVSAGQRHTCAITVDRALYCWGENLQFETATQGDPIVTTPVPVMPGFQFLNVGAGTTETCAVRTNGVVYCWGEGTLGALGRGDTLSSVVPAPIASEERFVQVRSGRLRSCAIALDGGLWCWGLEWESTQGNVDFFHQRLLPHLIAGLPPLREVSVGVSSICALSVDGVSYCWESNTFAQLGTGTTTSAPAPTAVATEEKFTNVSSGIIQTCGTAVDGRAFCWGNNSFGQLGVPRPGEHCGDAALECSRRPIAVFGQQRFESVATGIGNHTCSVTLETAVLCWGLGSSGQLGDGYLRDRQSLPVGVLAPGT
jgi:alpha-tubulin suppressor-like RCC1 family protein